MKEKHGGKEKANDWMWQSQRESQLMIVKRPKTKDKKNIVLVFLTKDFIPTPIKSPTINDKFIYNDYILTLI